MVVVGLLLLTVPVYAGKILVLGDSLSAAHGLQLEQGWVSLLEKRLQKQGNWQVVNASVSGETTSGGLARLPALLETHQPDLCIIELGANDGLRGQPILAISQRLNRLIDTCEHANADVVYLGILLPPNYGKRYTDAFANMQASTVEKQDIPWVPFFLNNVGDKPELMQADGLHPTAEAQPIILNNIWPLLQPLL